MIQAAKGLPVVLAESGPSPCQISEATEMHQQCIHTNMVVVVVVVELLWLDLTYEVYESLMLLQVSNTTKKHIH